MKKAFTIIELLIVMLIIGLIMSVGLPRFTSIGTSEFDKFFARLNSITQEGAQKAQEFNVVYKILFNITGKKIELLPIDVENDKDKNNTRKKEFDIPDFISIEDFLIDNKSQFTSGKGEKRSAYFLINPMGITQNVKIIFINNNLFSKDPKTGKYEAVLNPFTAEFKIL